MLVLTRPERFRQMVLELQRAVLLIAPMMIGGAVLGADAISDLSEKWRWREFDVSEGLSSGSVSCLHQAADDFIYAATGRSLCRYDLHFWEEIEGLEGFEPGDVVRIVDTTDAVFCATRTGLWVVRGGRVLRKVYPDPDVSRGAGRILVAPGTSGEVFLIDAGHRQHLRVRDPRVDPVHSAIRLPPGEIRDYQIDAAGVHWLLTDVGVFSLNLDARLLSWREADLPAGSQCARLMSMRRAPRSPAEAQPTRRFALRQVWGVFWRRAEAERPKTWFLTRLQGDVWEPVSQDLEGALPESIAVDGLGNHYATCEDGRLFHRERSSSSWRRAENLWRGPVKLFGVIVDSRGDIWFRQGRGGIAFFNVLSQRWSRLPGLRASATDPYPNVLSLLETSTGELWVGTQKMGVFRYRRRGSGLVSQGVGEDPFLLLEESPVHYAEVSGQPLEGISALGEEVIVEDVPGRVWLGSQSRNLPGAYYFDLESETWGVENGSVAGRSLSVPIHRIVTDSRGELWFLPGRQEGGAHSALFRRSVYTVGRFERVEIAAAAEAGKARRVSAVNDLLRAGNGTPGAESFWLATEEGLLRCRLRDSTLEAEDWLDERDGLFSSRVWAVAEGPDDGSIWICYPSSGSGVTRIAGGELVHFDVKDGLASSEVWSIVRSGPNLWFGTMPGGLSRYDGQCWYSFPVASAGTDESHVYPILVPRTPGSEDRLVIGTWEQGVLLYRADDIRKPRIVKRSFPERFARNRPVVLEWKARDYKNQTLPEHLIYRYRLDAGGWRTARGIESASLGPLPVGRHIFELEVRDLDGYQNWRSVSHEFEVHSAAPLWPLAAGGIALAGAALAAVLLAALRVARVRRAAYSRYRRFYLRHPHAVFLIDPAGRVRDYNGRDADLLGLGGFRRGDVLGRPLSSVPALGPLPLAAHISGLSRGTAFRLETWSGSPSRTGARLLEVRGYPLSSPAGDGGAGPWSERACRACRGEEGGIIEIEDRTLAEEERRLSLRENRLEGLRDLARRITGDVEAAIEAAARAAQERAPSGGVPPSDRRLERLREVLQGLKAFSMPAGERRSSGPVEIDALLESILADREEMEASWLAPGRVRVDYRSQTGLWTAAADPAMVEESLREVLRNAEQALGEGGILTLRASNLRIEGDAGSLPDGLYVEVAVQDDGPGIDAAQLETIFDPFYSTKPRDLARGIGLSVAYGLVRSQGGDIRVHSRPGEGTRVRILLPATPSI
ncbi:MAG: hypothetical protein JXA90_09820 [Planctomycetes bacterium]|nr:hypothetical protein [Planctomycetota bacterium]